MPATSVLFSPALAGPSAALQEVVDLIILETGSLAKTVSPAGGVQASKLRDVLRDITGQHGLVDPSGDTFAAAELAWESRENAFAVAIQGGRAATNNGGLVSVLAAADRPGIDWLILVLPERYKGGATYANVLKQMGALSRAGGVRLNLAGMTLVGF